jgi:hypothetical protein
MLRNHWLNRRSAIDGLVIWWQSSPAYLLAEGPLLAQYLSGQIAEYGRLTVSIDVGGIAPILARSAP